MSAIGDVTYLVAQTTHGPGMHGPVLVALVLVVAVGGLIYLVRSRMGRAGSERDPASEHDSAFERIPSAIPRATGTPDPESDRDPDE